MDKITKFLRKLDEKELKLVSEIIKKLLINSVHSLDIKKLKGFDNIYRVRIKDLRIIYSQINGVVRLIEVSRRSEKTYKKY